MAKVFVLREGFLDRVRKMSGLKSEEAFAGALHVSGRVTNCGAVA